MADPHASRGDPRPSPRPAAGLSTAAQRGRPGTAAKAGAGAVEAMVGYCMPPGYLRLALTLGGRPLTLTLEERYASTRPAPGCCVCDRGVHPARRAGAAHAPGRGIERTSTGRYAGEAVSESGDELDKRDISAEISPQDKASS